MFLTTSPSSILEQKTPEQKSESLVLAKRISIIVFTLLFGFLSAYFLASIIGRILAGEEIFSLLPVLAYPFIAVSLFTVFLLIFSVTSKLDSILIVNLILGAEAYFALAVKSSSLGIIGVLLFVFSLLIGSIAARNALEQFVKLNLSYLLKTMWRWISIGFVLFILFVHAVQFSYSAFPITQQTFRNLLHSTEPLFQRPLPTLSFKKTLSENLSDYARSNELLQSTGALDEIALNLAVQQQISSLNKTYNTKLTGNESLADALYSVARTMYAESGNNVQFVVFLGYLFSLFLILQFSFWIAGIVVIVIGLTTLTILRFIGFIKIFPAVATKEVLSLSTPEIIRPQRIAQ